jgi:acylpyruvate hydrolase
VKLATIGVAGTTRAVRADGPVLIDLGAPDLGEFLATAGWQERAAAASATAPDAENAIAGFTVLNDLSARDWQFRTKEWLQGKIWDRSTPVGPYLVTPDELPGGTRPELTIELVVDGATMQRDNTGDLLFDPVALVEYISTITRLNPGDLIATGTPGGVGNARQPPRFLVGGETVTARIEGLGETVNKVVKEVAP